MPRFPIVDLSDDHALSRFTMLAEVLGWPVDTDPGYLLDEAVKRLRDEHDEEEEDETDTRWGRAMDSIADTLGMERDNNPVHLLEEAAHQLARLAPRYTVGSLVRGDAVSDLPEGARVVEADEDGTPTEYGVVLQVRSNISVPRVVEAQRFYVIVSLPGSG